MHTTAAKPPYVSAFTYSLCCSHRNGRWQHTRQCLSFSYVHHMPQPAYFLSTPAAFCGATNERATTLLHAAARRYLGSYLNLGNKRIDRWLLRGADTFGRFKVTIPTLSLFSVRTLSKALVDDAKRTPRTRKDRRYCESNVVRIIMLCCQLPPASWRRSKFKARAFVRTEQRGSPSLLFVLHTSVHLS